MTGEVTLQGRVLPIGGLKQKVLAAHAAGLTDVILPERNRGDLDDVPEEVREQMTLPPGDDDRRGARAGARAGGAAPMSPRCRSCAPVPAEVRRAADLLERRWTLSIALRLARAAPSASTSSGRRSAAIPPATLAERLDRARGGRRARAARWSTRGRRASSTGPEAAVRPLCSLASSDAVAPPAPAGPQSRPPAPARSSATARLSVLALIVVSAGLGVVSPFLLRDVLDEAIPENDDAPAVAARRRDDRDRDRHRRARRRSRRCSRTRSASA